jgi:hypothetical protein
VSQPVQRSRSSKGLVWESVNTWIEFRPSVVHVFFDGRQNRTGRQVEKAVRCETESVNTDPTPKGPHPTVYSTTELFKRKPNLSLRFLSPLLSKMA